MPLSPNNPDRNRNFVVLVLAACFVFALLMAAFVALQLHGATDADAYLRFLTLIVVNLVPGALASWYAFAAHRSSSRVRDDIQNGVLKDKVKEGMTEVLAENGTAPPPTQEGTHT